MTNFTQFWKDRNMMTKSKHKHIKNEWFYFLNHLQFWFRWILTLTQDMISSRLTRAGKGRGVPWRSQPSCYSQPSGWGCCVLHYFKVSGTMQVPGLQSQTPAFRRPQNDRSDTNVNQWLKPSETNAPQKCWELRSQSTYYSYMLPAQLGSIVDCLRAGLNHEIVQIPTLPLTSCVILGNCLISLYLNVPSERKGK